jgi:hypothetical protein
MDFFTEELVSGINDLHVDTLNKVNENEEILDLTYKKATMEEVMD